MKIPKLLKLSQALLTDDKNNKDDRKKCLKEIQRKLKKKSKRLKEKLDCEANEDLKKIIKKDLAVVKAQRKKVVNELLKLKENKD